MEDSSASTGDLIRPELGIDDEDEACILEELAQDIRHLLQDPEAGAIQMPVVEAQPPKL